MYDSTPCSARMNQMTCRERCRGMPRAKSLVPHSKLWWALVPIILLALAPVVEAKKQGRTYPVETGSLPATIAKLLRRARVPQTGIGIYIHDVTQPRPLLVVNGERPFNPASAVKALTTFVAMDRLGPNFKWRTELWLKGKVRGGTLKGDLILKGGGDPSLSTERLWKLLHGAWARGLRHIHGDFIIDATYFDHRPPPRSAFDGNTYSPYNAPPFTALLNFNATRFVIRPMIGENTITVFTDPPLANLTIDNRMTYRAGKCRPGHRNIDMVVLDSGQTPRVRFKGEYGAGCGETALTRVVSTNETHLFGAAKSLWQRMGGTITGKVVLAATPRGARRLVSLESPVLSNVIRNMNKDSNNVMVRQLLLTLGAERLGRPGTLDKGRAVILDWLRSWRADVNRAVIDNGAGLSRKTRVTANAMGRFLHVAYASPLVTEFMSSLAVSGIDGTLRKRFVKQPLQGRVHIKTGTLDHVRAMAGYVLSGKGRRFIVVVLENHRGAHYIGAMIQNAILRWLFKQ